MEGSRMASDALPRASSHPAMVLACKSQAYFVENGRLWGKVKHWRVYERCGRVHIGVVDDHRWDGLI